MSSYQNDFRVINSIKKSVKERSWKCLHAECKCKSINSHFLQQKGVLDIMLINNHLYEMKQNDLFDMHTKGTFGFKKVGIKKAFSLPLFCPYHDTQLFKAIENNNAVSFYDYKTQLLLSYRSCCNEIRRKEIVFEEYRRILKSTQIQNPLFKIEIGSVYKSQEMGIKDFYFFKTCFESELYKKEQYSFTFKVYEYPLIKICASGVFSPLDNSDPIKFKKYVQQEKPLNSIFVNVFPYRDKTVIIFGYSKEFSDDWIVEYVNSWGDLSEVNLGFKLTDLITARMNSWTLSPDLYDIIPAKKKDEFLQYWNIHMNDLSINQVIGFNLFEKISAANIAQTPAAAAQLTPLADGRRLATR
jgi:hypothetical protein